MEIKTLGLVIVGIGALVTGYNGRNNWVILGVLLVHWGTLLIK